MDVSHNEVQGIKQQNVATHRSPTCKLDWRGVIKRRLPILTWLPYYTFAKFFQDILAGFTVGLTEIPQAIAYAVVAGLEPQYGLYSGIMECVVYFFCGTCKDINIGPTAIMAMMILPHVEKMGPDMAVLITFLAGAIILILGILQLGFLVEFFSYPVISGFTTAAAIQIASSQIKGLLGLPGKATEFLDAWKAVIEHITEIQPWDTLLGIGGIILLALLKYVRKYGTRTHRPEWSTSRNAFGKLIWFFSVASNAVVVIIGTFLAWLFYINGMHPFKLTGTIGKGLPTVQPPPFSTEFNNQTYTFIDMAKQYQTSIAFVPLIAILEHVAITKAFAKGKKVDATQELVALGLSNIAGSFLRSMPVTGSFTRTAVNNVSGVQTTLGGLVTGGMVLLALGLLTSTFYFIPKASLASVVMCAMFYLIEFDAIVTLWRTKKIDLVPFVATLIASLLLGLEYGIIIGVATNLMFVLYASARPTINIEKEKFDRTEVFLVTPTRSLQFPSAEFLKEKVIQDCDTPNTIVVVNGKYINGIDATVAKNFKILADDLLLREQNIVFWNFKPSVISVCTGVDKELIEHFKEGTLEEVIECNESFQSVSIYL